MSGCYNCHIALISSTSYTNISPLCINEEQPPVAAYQLLHMMIFKPQAVRGWIPVSTNQEPERVPYMEAGLRG